MVKAVSMDKVDSMGKGEMEDLTEAKDSMEVREGLMEVKEDLMEVKEGLMEVREDLLEVTVEVKATYL